MKVRLYKGPFSGKVYDMREAGQTEIVIRDYKKMSRKQRYEAEVAAYQTDRYLGNARQWRPPLIEARYRICSSVRTYAPADVRTYANPTSSTVHTVMMHPDGSLFYEWTGWKREFPW